MIRFALNGSFNMKKAEYRLYIRRFTCSFIRRYIGRARYYVLYEVV